MTLSLSARSCSALAIAACAAFSGFAQSNLPHDLEPQSRARLPYVRRADLDEKGQKIFDTLPGRGKDGVLGGPLAFSAYNLPVAQALHDLHDAAVTGGTLAPRTRELAILVACRETNYNLEWNGHQAIALKAGLEPKVIDVVRLNGPLTGLDEKDATVIRFGRELFHDKRVTSATFAKAVELWDKRGTMDMVAVMNTYAVSGYFAIAVDEHAPDDKPELPPVK